MAFLDIFKNLGELASAKAKAGASAKQARRLEAQLKDILKAKEREKMPATDTLKTIAGKVSVPRFIQPQPKPELRPIQKAIAKMTPEEKMAATGRFTKEIAQVFPAIITKVGVSLYQAPTTIRTLGEEVPEPVKLPKALQFITGKEEITSYAKDAEKKIDAGGDPLKTFLLVGAQASWDTVIVGSLLKFGADQVVKNIKAPDTAHYGAWEKLGSPKTMAEADKQRRSLQHLFHPDRPTATASNEAMTQVNNAWSIVKTQGIPKAPPQPLAMVRDVAQSLNTPVSELMKLKSAQPFLGVKGLIPERAGFVPEKPFQPMREPALGLGIKEKPLKPIKPTVPPSPPQAEVTAMAGKAVEDPVVKLTGLIKDAKPLRGKLEKAFTAERAKRITEVEKAITEVGGEKGYKIALSKLKGELAPGAKIKFEPVKEQLSQPEINALYDRTFKHPYLTEWEKVTSANELTKLLSGELPTPKGLVLLEEVYGSDLVKNILTKRAMGLKIKDTLIEIINIPRALMATLDMSAFLRQGGVYAASHPVLAKDAAVTAIGKFTFSSKNFEQYFKDLKKDPIYPLMRKSNLGITDPFRAAAGLKDREEAFIFSLAKSNPVVKALLYPIAASERNYVGFLNKLRVDVFKSFVDEAVSKGMSITADAEYFKAVANMVNVMTGRGSLGKIGNELAPLLNTVFFSPRLNVARFNALNPFWYAKQPKGMRLKAVSDFGKFVSLGLTVLALAKASGVDVENDPRSSDFGKIKIGDTRWDIWGGHQQWARVMAQLITGERKSTTTGKITSLNKDEFPFSTRKDVLYQFIEGKLAPVPALVKELADGAKTFTGEDITVSTAAMEKLIPMYIQDVADAYKEGGLGKAVGAGVPAFFGVGVQTWTPKPKEFKVKDFSGATTTPSGFKTKNYAK